MVMLLRLEVPRVRTRLGSPVSSRSCSLVVLRSPLPSKRLNGRFVEDLVAVLDWCELVFGEGGGGGELDSVGRGASLGVKVVLQVEQNSVGTFLHSPKI